MLLKIKYSRAWGILWSVVDTPICHSTEETWYSTLPQYLSFTNKVLASSKFCAYACNLSTWAFNISMLWVHVWIFPFVSERFCFLKIVNHLWFSLYFCLFYLFYLDFWDLRGQLWERNPIKDWAQPKFSLSIICSVWIPVFIIISLRSFSNGVKYTLKKCWSSFKRSTIKHLNNVYE